MRSRFEGREKVDGQEWSCGGGGGVKFEVRRVAQRREGSDLNETSPPPAIRFRGQGGRVYWTESCLPFSF